MDNTLLSAILKKPFQTLVLTGDVHSIRASVEYFFKTQESIGFEGHADTALHVVDSLTIDLARDIQEWTEGMPQYRLSKLLVLVPSIFPYVSQNTLLKTFEEPHGNTQIILIVKDASMLLPTILSRAIQYTIPSEPKKYADVLLQHAPHERLTHSDVTPLLKTGVQKPSKEEVAAFFQNLVGAVLQAPYSEKERKEAIEVLTAATPYIHDQGASVKMLVEYACLQIPVLDTGK